MLAHGRRRHARVELHVVDFGCTPLPRLGGEWRTIYSGEGILDGPSSGLGFNDGGGVVQYLVLVNALGIDDETWGAVIALVAHDKSICLIEFELHRDEVVVPISPDAARHWNVLIMG